MFHHSTKFYFYQCVFRLYILRFNEMFEQYLFFVFKFVVMNTKNLYGRLTKTSYKKTIQRTIIGIICFDAKLKRYKKMGLVFTARILTLNAT